MGKEITIKIQRFDPEKDKKPYFASYKIPFKPAMRVLDAIKYIKNNLDGTLSYRWNCSMGICGSCAMEVNGVPVLTCKTELRQNLLGVTIAPMKAFPVIKDLVPDYSPHFEKEKELKPYFMPETEKKEFFTMSMKDVELARKFKSCIECFICNDSCRPFRDKNNVFLGPKSIVKARAYQLHPYDKFDRTKLLEKEGIWNCNITRCCQNNCPQGIPITDKGIIPTLEKKGKNK